MGKDPAELYRFPESYGYGDQAYMGMLDVFHHLHCLNHLRRAANHQYYANLSSTSIAHTTTPSAKFPREVHLEHCTYILLQFIMCHADVGIITFNKVQGTPGPFADFNVEHKCRDFQSVLKWKGTKPG